MLETDRLILRQWQASDHQPFIEMGLDPEVMQYFPKCLTATDSLNLIQRVSDAIQRNQWGFWAVELKSTGQFIGFVGLHQLETQFDFSPCVEVGWRLAKAYWGHGYATEAAQASLNYAFDVLNLEKVVAFTAIINHPSQAVMKRLGMYKVKEFNHPELSDGHQLQKHVLYEILKPSLV